MNKKKLRVMLDEDYDTETNAMAVCVEVLSLLTFDQAWRVLNYLCVRILKHRSWSLGRPKGDKTSD